MTKLDRLRKENFYQRVEILRLKAQLAMTQNDLIGAQMKLLEQELTKEEAKLLQEIGE